MPASGIWGWASGHVSDPAGMDARPSMRKAIFSRPRNIAAALGALVLVGIAAVTHGPSLGAGRDELLVLGPLGFEGEPWVLTGGVDGVLGQLSFDHKRSEMMHKLREKHARGRTQQLTEQIDATKQLHKGSSLVHSANAQDIRQAEQYEPDYPETKTVHFHEYHEEENPFEHLQSAKYRYQWEGQQPEANAFDKVDQTTEDIPPRSTVVDEKSGQYVPDDPTTQTVHWRPYKEEKNVFENLDTEEHHWHIHVPEENVFEDAGKVYPDVRGEPVQQVDAEVGADDEREVGVDSEYGEGREQVFEEAARAKQSQLTGDQAQEITRLKANLRAAKKKIQAVERDGGHAWRKERPIENVLNSVFPRKQFVWKKQTEVLPNVWATMDAKPVKWHPYRADKPNYIGFLSQKKYAWHGQKQPEKNVLADMLPTAAHKWKGQHEELNVIDSLPDEQHKWKHTKPEEYNVLDELPTEPHEWGTQAPQANVLDGLSDASHIWHKMTEPHNVFDSLNSAPHVWKKTVDAHNVLSGLPSEPYAWTGPHLHLDNQLGDLPTTKHKWTAYKPDKSPISELPSAEYIWKGQQHEESHVLDGLSSQKRVWHPQNPDNSPLSNMKVEKYVWKGPGTPDRSPVSDMKVDKYVWKGPGTQSDGLY